MENIKEELRQLIKEKILSTIMEGKKPVHAPRGPKKPKSKTWSGHVKTGSETTQERREGKKQAQEMSESREAVLKSIARSSLADIAENQKKIKPKTEKSIPYNKLTVSDLFRRYQEITKPK